MAWSCSGRSGTRVNKGFAQVSEVPIGISLGGDPFVHLHHMHLLPRDFFARQGTQHLPGSMASADGHEEATACDDSVTSLRGNDRGSLAGNRIGVGKNFNLHVCASTPDQPVTVGFCQPPGGTTCLSTSAGPQVFGSYSWTGVFAFSTGSTMRQASST
jgi:hypothetical protein